MKHKIGISAVFAAKRIVSACHYLDKVLAATIAVYFILLLVTP